MSKRFGQTCVRVVAGKPIEASEWKDESLAKRYAKFIGKPRCTCALMDSKSANPNSPAMKQLCANAGLPLKVGNHIFTGEKAMEGYEGEMEGGLAELSAAIDVYNYKQTAIGGGIGLGIGGVAGFAIDKLPVGGFWDWVRIVGPGLALAALGAFLGKKNPVTGAAVASSGLTITGIMLAKKLTGQPVDVAPVQGLADLFSESDLFGTELQLNGPESLYLPGGQTIGRIEPDFASEEQEIGFEGLTLENETQEFAGVEEDYNDVQLPYLV